MKSKKLKIGLILLIISAIAFSAIFLSIIFKPDDKTPDNDVYEKLDLSQFSDYGSFGDEGLMWVKTEDYTGIQYGCINTEGEYVIPLTSKIVGVHRMKFEHGYSIAYMDSSERSPDENNDNCFGVIYNAKGQIVYKFEYDDSPEYKFLNNGNIYMRDIYPYEARYFDNLVAYMFCDGSGNVVKMPSDDNVGMYSDGLLCVKGGYERGDWNSINYFDAEGNHVLNVNNSSEYYKHVLWASDFNNGTATVKFVGMDNNKYYVDIDKTGKWVSEPEITYSD